MEPTESKNLIRIEISGITDSCRVCMAQDLNMSNIFDESGRKIVDEIQFCTGLLLKKEDRLPSRICDICLKNLSTAFNFKTACLLADSTFKKILRPMIKIEVPDYDIKEDYDLTKNDDHILQSDDNIIQYEQSVIDDNANDTKKNIEIMVNGLLQHTVKQHKKIKLKKKKSSSSRLKIGKKISSKIKQTKKGASLIRTKSNPLACDACNLKFENKEQAIAHKKEVHRDEECWVCEICGKVFIHRASHYSHVKSHRPPEYSCDQCDYSTGYKHDLTKHLRTHGDIRQYQCEYCTASYHTSSNLKGHIRRFHEKEKRYSCTLCDKQFYDRTKMNRHMDAHNEVKRHECEVCHACFTRRCYWKKHRLRQHNIVTPPQRPGRKRTNFVADGTNVNDAKCQT